MTALTTLRDALGRATAGKWYRPPGDAHAVAIPVDSGAHIVVALSPCPNSPFKSSRFNTWSNDAAAIVQSISLARVVVDPETVGKIGLMIDNQWNELETPDDIAQAVLECLASMAVEEGKLE